jgi:predicted acetyltransferase
LLDKKDIDEAKALWKSSFDDSDAFIDTYFENKIIPHNSLGMFDDGLACVVHMLPERIRVQGKALKSGYIAGAATAQKKQNRGYMRIMLQESLQLMNQRGIVMTHLYPFKHSFYEKFGWGTYSYVQKKVVKVGKPAGGRVEPVTERSLLVPLYRKMMAKFDGYVIRTASQWDGRLSELLCDGGKAVVLYEEDVPVAYMMYYEEDGNADVIEAVFSREEQAQSLAEHIAQGCNEVRYSLPTNDDTSAPQGMARIVDVVGLLEELDAMEVLRKMQVVDAFANCNNRGSSRNRIQISELAQIVHRGVPRGLLDEKKKKSPYNILNEKFIQRSTCIFEEY